MASNDITMYRTIILFLSIWILFLILDQKAWNEKAIERFQAKCTSDRMINIFTAQAPARRAAMRQVLQSNESDFSTFYNTLVPEVACEELVRIGTTNDGGKWMCSPHNLPNGCTVLSLGLNNVLSFDLDLQKLTDSRCSLLGVDAAKQWNTSLNRLKKVNGRAVVATLGTQKNTTTIQQLMRNEHIDKVEILKIDIEGAEFDVLIPFLDDVTVSQILIEIHTDQNAAQMLRLLREMGGRGYWIVSYEINGRRHDLSEVTLIHESAFSRYSATPLARYMTF